MLVLLYHHARELLGRRIRPLGYGAVSDFGGELISAAIGCHLGVVVVMLQSDRIDGIADLLDCALLGCVELLGELGEKHRIE